MSDPHALEKLRPLGLLEKYSSSRHALGYYNNVAVTAHYSNPGFCGPLQPLIYRALATVIARNPILSAIAVDEDKSDTFFARLPQIDLRRAVKFVARKDKGEGHDEEADLELEELIEEQHNTNFKDDYGQLPFWRVIILHSTESTSHFVACFVFHHSLCDGASGLALHRSLLSALDAEHELQSTSQAEDEDPIVYPPQTPLLPSLEDLLPLPLSMTYLLRVLWNEYVAKAPQHVWTGAAITTPTPLQGSRFRLFTISSRTTKGLLSVSRTNSTTLTATIETLLASALFTHLPLENYAILVGNGAISLRRFLPREVIDDESAGTYVSAYKVLHHRPSSGPDDQHSNDGKEAFSWDEARRMKATIEIELSKKGKDSVVGLLRYAGDLISFLSSKVGKQRDQSFEVSNIGVFKLARAGQGDESWSIGKMTFSQSANVVGPAVGVSVVTGGDGCLTLGFSWLDGVVEGEWVETVMKCLKDKMKDLAR